MIAGNASDTESADYDDLPGRQANSPLFRVLRAGGALTTLGLAVIIGGAVTFRIQLAGELFLGGAVLSFASFPLIILFWTEEVSWKGNRLSVAGTVFVVSVLTWVAEVMVWVFIIVLAVVIFGK